MRYLLKVLLLTILSGCLETEYYEGLNVVKVSEENCVFCAYRETSLDRCFVSSEVERLERSGDVVGFDLGNVTIWVPEKAYEGCGGCLPPEKGGSATIIWGAVLILGTSSLILGFKTTHGIRDA